MNHNFYASLYTNIHRIDPTIETVKIYVSPNAKPIKQNPRKLAPICGKPSRLKLISSKKLDSSRKSNTLKGTLVLSLSRNPLTKSNIYIEFKDLRDASPKDIYLLPYTDMLISKTNGLEIVITP